MSENTVNLIGMQGGDRAGVTADDLTLDTKIQIKDRGIQTVRELVRSGLVGSLRCRSPFSESEGLTASIATDLEGLPFVQDHSTGVRHCLTEAGRGSSAWRAPRRSSTTSSLRSRLTVPWRCEMTWSNRWQRSSRLSRQNTSASVPH